LVSRLETVTSRLEQVEKQIATGAVAAPSAGGAAAASSGDGSESPAVVEYGNLIDQHIRPFVEVAKKIAPEVGQQAELVLRAVEAQKQFIAIAATSKKPADVSALLKPTSSAMEEISTLRDKSRTSKFFNNLSAVSEGIPALGWVIIEKTPGPHVGEMRGSSEFYSNRILKDFKGKDETQVAFVTHFNTFLKELQTYVKNYHTTGLTWNPKGGEATAAAAAAPSSAPKPPAAAPPPPAAAPPASSGDSKGPDTNALFAALNKGDGVTSGLKKVTNDMKTKNRPDSEKTSVVPAGNAPAHKESTTGGAKAAAKKPPKFGLDGNKWSVENQENNRELVISETETKHVVYIYGCSNSTVQIKGKVNAITIDNCKRTAVVFENAVSGVEVVNCTSLEVQILGKVPSVAIDKTSGIQVYLSKDSIEAEIVTSKSSEMNVLLPAVGDADLVEIPIPEQYKSVVKGNKLVTECVQHSG